MYDRERMSLSLETHLSIYNGSLILSPESTSQFVLDPSYWLWRLSRYKHVSRILDGRKSVLEIGCGDGFASPMVASCVESLHCVEFLPDLFKYADENLSPLFNNLTFSNFSFPEDFDSLLASSPNSSGYDAVFCLDVFEHIQPSKAPEFTLYASRIIRPDGIYIVGIPSLESQAFASEGSKIGHVNCLSRQGLRDHLDSYFGNVVLLGINDETLHTGFAPMTHYHLAICSLPLNV